MSCNKLIAAGVPRNCDIIEAAIGLDKDLILVNYEDFDKVATKLVGNREADDTNGNQGGLSAIQLKSGAIQYVFEGSDYSVVPTVTPETKEDGTVVYVHSLAFTVYDKSAKTRKVIEDLGSSLVIAIAVDRSTGLYEIFGMDQGLRLNGVERAYIGTQNSNFYAITIATPDIAVVRETTLGELAIAINTAI